jgi:protein TonB
VPPDYPAIARAARVQGAVILEAVLDERGKVDRVRVLRSIPLLDEAALGAVRQWRYTPTLLNGVPVPVLMTITVHFTLHE